MNIKLLEHLSCLECGKGKFCTTGKLGNAVVEAGAAALKCDYCGETYPVLNEIARFVPVSNYADSFGVQWNAHAATQLDSQCGVTVSRDRVFSVTAWPEEMKGETILEAGSGAGRFTEVLATTRANILSFDYSSAVDANRSNNGNNDNVLIFQADIFNIPVPDHSIDKVFCLGVIQHTPDPKAAFMSLASKVRPGGSLVVDIYALGLKSIFQWKYALRPITMHIDNEKLYKFVSAVAPLLIAPTKLLRRLAGRWGAQLSPIVEYSYLGLDDKTNTQWVILDTFDMYSPAHDHPKSENTVFEWFKEIGFVNVHVGRGPNGIIGRGVRPFP